MLRGLRPWSHGYYFLLGYWRLLRVSGELRQVKNERWNKLISLGGRRGKLVAVSTDREQVNWATEKLEFGVRNLNINSPSCMRGEKKENILSSEHGATGQFESHLYGYEA